MNQPSFNQFAPPMAEVADVAPPTGTAELRFFSARGRIGRLRYLAWSTGASVLHAVFTMALGAMLASAPVAIGVLIALAYIPLIWFSVLCGIKRCHDIDISGWWTLTLIIPVIALVWIFVPGSKAGNRFGPPPPPNSWGVRILGVILPIFFFVGILAAVALPAYKTYGDRARPAEAARQK